MSNTLDASAPHLHAASTIALPTTGAHASALDNRSRWQRLELWQDPSRGAQAGVWSATPGAWQLALDEDLFAHFTAGVARYHANGDEPVAVGPDTVLHLKKGWRGEVEAVEPLRCVYMRCPAAPGGGQRLLYQALSAAPLTDWGDVPTAIDGRSHTSGILLQRDRDGAAESGVWVCTPGTWRCEVTRDELCHFLLGRCTYTHESGDVIDVSPDTLALFPAGWRGVCGVHETVRKAYFIA